ncbi:MAG: glucose-6-phosphate dehydrogenase [Anaerolineae bacterium]|nr:glucose-6-phosphate dehydrogenase [Anaerolineae bacterium]
MQSSGVPSTIVIFGASGDLTQRKLVPALHTLACEGMLPESIRILGVARSEFSDEAFRDHLYEGVEAYARHKPHVCHLWSGFADRHSYLQGDYDDPATYRRLAERLAIFDREDGTQGNRLFYLSVPPVVYSVVVEQLGKAGLNHSERGWTRIVVEKPFGHDFESARELNDRIHRAFDEDQVFRIDHYLGKETVQNILTFRFANAIFEPLWSRSYIDHVQISVTESVVVGRRGGYYDKAGVLRDMFQNHLLQLLTLTAMEPPATFSADALRDEKVKVLRAVRSSAAEDVVFGQYEGYLDEEGVSSDSTTPTYAALRFYVDNWRWQGVPFYLRSGKGLQEKSTEVTLVFKHVPHLLFPENVDLKPNRLALCIQPDEAIRLTFETKHPGAGMRTAPVNMGFRYDQDFGDGALPEAYERLLLDALQGDASLFTRADEIELAWKIIDPLPACGDPRPYEIGSWGPEAANDLVGREDSIWYHGCTGDEG